MSCASEVYAAFVSAHPSLCLLDHSGDGVESRIRQREIHRSRAADGSPSNAPHVVPDSSKTDPESVWGDEGPISE
jgi:hypothetical protein